MTLRTGTDHLGLACQRIARTDRLLPWGPASDSDTLLLRYCHPPDHLLTMLQAVGYGTVWPLQMTKSRNRLNVDRILGRRVAAPTMRAWYWGEQSQISQNAISSLTSGMGRPPILINFGSNFSPDTRAIPLCRRLSTEVSADRPETSVAARPWSSPA